MAIVCQSRSRSHTTSFFLLERLTSGGGSWFLFPGTPNWPPYGALKV